MGYLPLFDISTLHYTNYALQFLLDEDKNLIKRYISEINKLYSLGKNPDYLYSHLRDSVYIFNGGQPDSNGFQPFQGDGFSIDYGASSKGGELVRLIFGILCLTKFVEAICLSERIYYTSASPWMTVSIKDRWPMLHVFLEDSGIEIFDPLAGSDELKEDFYNWLKQDKYSFYSIEKSLLEKFALNCFEFPFMNLASLLFDTSFGISNAPMTIECTPDYEVMHPRSLWNENSEINVMVDAINPSVTSLSQIRRMYFYLMKSFQYQYICDYIDADYVWNEIRGPFLWSILSAKPINDIDRLLDIIALGIGIASSKEDQHGKKIGMQKSMIFDSSAILRLVLSRMSNLTEIFREAKKVRNELDSIRILLDREGNSETVIQNVLSSMASFSIMQNDFSLDTQPFQETGWTANDSHKHQNCQDRPAFTGGLNHYNGYVKLAKAYMGAYSVAERLLKLIENRE